MSGWAFAMIVATTMLMAVVLMLRGPVARAFGPHAAYALWALPALRMAMPSLPGWGLFSVFHFAARRVSGGPADLPGAPRMANEGTANVPLAPGEAIHWFAHWPTILLAVWLGGAVVWFGWQMLRYHRFLARALRSAELMGSECGIDVLLTGEVDGPVAAGVIRRRIFLPAAFMTRYSAAERRCALLHEAAHHDRHDIAANLVALVVLALHWWNPLAHRAYKAFRADQELACDATVLADVASDERHAYGSAVVKSASARMPGVACALSHKDEIKRRLRNMAAPQLGARRMWAGVAVAAATIGAGLMVTASGYAAQVAPATVASAEIRTDADAVSPEPARDAIEGQRAAQTARREADQARAEAMRARALAETDAAQARQDGLAAAAQARAEAAQARSEADQERSQALREAADARRQGLADAADARAEARREIAQARRDVEQALNEARREAAEVRGQP